MDSAHHQTTAAVRATTNAGSSDRNVPVISVPVLVVRMIPATVPTLPFDTENSLIPAANTMANEMTMVSLSLRSPGIESPRTGGAGAGARASGAGEGILEM